MLKQLITALILTLAAGNGLPGQTPDSFDTCYTRGQKLILVPRYDTIKQLDKLNEKTDTTIEKLKIIAEKLNIKDTVQ